MTETLKNQVLKTASVTSVKLVTAADRIGLGLGVVAYPMDNLSAGPILAPCNPEPEHVGSRRELSTMQMRQQMQWGNAVATPASSAGCPCSTGVSAMRSVLASALPFTGWRKPTRTAAADRARRAILSADPSQADFPRDLGHHEPSGRDCQSLQRFRDKRDATRKTAMAAIAGK